MNSKDYQGAIQREVESWPGVTVEFPKTTGKHPKAKLIYVPPGTEDEPVMLSRPYASTPSDSFHGVHQMLGDMRRAMKSLGATRATPEPSKDEDEAPYRKANDGPAKRDPLPHIEKADPKPDVADQLVEAGAITPEQAAEGRQVTAPDVWVVGDDFEPDEDAEAEAARASLQALVDAIVDGIYFDLPDTVYHAVPRLSSSGLQKLCVSPGTFWRKSWLDPDRPELDAKPTDAQLLGKAYHTARLEPDLFDALYVRKLDKADAPRGTLFTGPDMAKALKELGEKSSGSVAEQAERLVAAGYRGCIWQVQLAAWEEERRGRIAIDSEDFDQIVTDMERIRGNQEIAEKLSGGQAEVSIFWTDRNGLKMKARVDYLTARWWVDFKTFDNSRGKVLAQALADAMRYNRYHVQAVTYREAVEAIRTSNLQIIGKASEAQRKLIAAIQMRPGELACWYIFQEKGGVPNVIAKQFPFFTVPLNTQAQDIGASDEGVAAVHAGTQRRTRLHMRAAQDIDHAKRTFATYSQVYQPGDPWNLIDAVGAFDDADFNDYWLDGKVV